MARPVQGTLIELLQRDHMHSRDIGVVLESLRQQLTREGIPFALIGALALRHYGYARHTEDIDILTTPRGSTGSTPRWSDGDCSLGDRGFARACVRRCTR